MKNMQKVRFNFTTTHTEKFGYRKMSYREKNELWEKFGFQKVFLGVMENKT